METFSRHSSEATYIMLRSEQLVGTALMIIVKESLLPAIRGIEYASKKTGLQGLSGNKGGIGFRFNLYDATVCLMTCHLAAGQSNFADRNADYRTISNGLTFLRGKTIDSHDIVIWAADFNYRIDLPNEEVREYATTDQLDILVASDQLGLARDDGEVFLGYSEGALTFRPTYKYDNGTDEYDSSEKQRIPAWTDRVLYKGEGLHLRGYGAADLRTSDHRPVYALFEAVVPEVDEARRSAIAAELASKARAASGEKLDAKIEKAAQGGVRGLVKEFTSVSLAPSPSRSAASTPEPRAPPPFSRDTKPRPKANFAQTVNSAYARLGQPPPLPPRNGAASPAEVTPASATAGGSVAVPYEPRRRPAPPPPAEFKKIGLPPDPHHEEMTPVATGDFVLVPSPQRPPAPPLPQRKLSTVSAASVASSSGSGPAPSLPPRPRPAPPRAGTLDLDAPPPANLVPAVAPDNRPALPSAPKPTPRSTQAAEFDRAKADEAAAEADVKVPAAKDEKKAKVPPPTKPKPQRAQSIEAPSEPQEGGGGKKAPPPLAPTPVRKPSVSETGSPTKAPPPLAPKPQAAAAVEAKPADAKGETKAGEGGEDEVKTLKPSELRGKWPPG